MEVSVEEALFRTVAFSPPQQAPNPARPHQQHCSSGVVGSLTRHARVDHIMVPGLRDYNFEPMEYYNSSLPDAKPWLVGNKLYGGT